MAESEAIRCMQLPLADVHLLVPNSAVAEIIGYDRPVRSETSDAAWYQGEIPWRGVKVPVVSIEQMCALQAATTGARTRIAVLYNPAGSDDLPYLGVVLRDIPRAFLAEPERMSGEATASDCNFISSQLQESLGQLMIPDLDAIIAALRQQLVH